METFLIPFFTISFTPCTNRPITLMSLQGGVETRGLIHILVAKWVPLHYLSFIIERQEG